MKRITIICMTIFISSYALAQKHVTEFLGIPIDGSKSAMIQKLKNKGFQYNSTLDYLTGEFNGQKVNVHVVTNNNKVWRIMIQDVPSTRNESDIIIRFNRLCSQFAKNKKYMPQNIEGKFEIDQGEDISIQMSLYNKRYEAAYFQIFESDYDTTGASKIIMEKLQKTYTSEQINNLSEEEKMQFAVESGIEVLLGKVSKRSVWFMIVEEYGRYSIIMYYDNEYNYADGEDL